jgi:hypothetical protein
MKFCSICNSKMNRIIKDGSIFYECECKNTVDAEDDELCVLDENFVDEDNVDKYTEIIKNSPYDKSANLIKRPCNKCTRTYMTHIHVSKHQTSIYTCICGNYVSIEH